MFRDNRENLRRITKKIPSCVEYNQEVLKVCFAKPTHTLTNRGVVY